jgi:hypothetical protein
MYTAMERKFHLDILKHLQAFSFLNMKKCVFFWNANFLSAYLCALAGA